MEPTVTPAPVTGNATIDHVLVIVGALVPLLSALAGFLNARVRARSAAGEAVSPNVLRAIALLNVGAVNLDKASQLVALAAGKPVPATAQAPQAQAPLEPPKQ